MILKQRMMYYGNQGTTMLDAEGPMTAAQKMVTGLVNRGKDKYTGVTKKTREGASPIDGCDKALGQPLLVPDECDTARKRA